MSEKMFNQEGEIKLDLIISAESYKNIARRDGFVLLNISDLNATEIDLDDLADELKKEGFERKGGLKDDVLYDPNKFEVKSVDVYRGLKEKDTEGGWKEVSRGGDTAILIREK